MYNSRILKNMFILEGSDCVGKSSIAKNLKERFTSNGMDAMIIKFPNYDSVTSKIIVDYLSNNIDIHLSNELYKAKTIANIYSIDRAITLNSAAPGGASLYEYMLSHPDTTFIVDRYTQSNIIHQTSNLSEDDLYEFGKWLFDLEFDSLQLPVPYTSFYLVPKSIDIIHRNFNTRGERRDILESDDRVLKAYTALTESKVVRELLFQTFPSIEKIKVDIDFDDTIDEISDGIYNKINCIMDDIF